jgi:hypothetical protein
MDARQTTRNRAKNSSGTQLADEVFVKQVEVSRIHGRDLPRQNRFVNNCGGNGRILQAHINAGIKGQIRQEIDFTVT